MLKCENGLVWKVEAWFEPNLVYWHNTGTFICSCSQRSYTKVKGHLRSSCKIGLKWENGLIWKVEVQLEPNLVYWYNMGIFIFSYGQRSYTKVKGHLKSSCRIGWKCENGLIWKVEVRCQPNCGDLDQMFTCIIHKPRRQATLAIRGIAKYFLFMLCPSTLYSKAVNLTALFCRAWSRSRCLDLQPYRSAFP